MINNNMNEDINRLQRQIDELKMQLSLQGQTQNYGVDFANLTNMVEVVTSVPTYTPRTVYEQVKLYYNSGGPTWELYIYDNVNSAWKNVTLGTFTRTYAGYVLSAGTAGSLPSGWSSGAVGTTYTITHNLGTGANSYAIVVTAMGTAGAVPKLDNIGTNTVNIYFTDRTGGLINTDFNFLLLTF